MKAAFLTFVKSGAVMRRKPQVKAECFKFRPALIRREPQVKAEVF